MLPFRQHALDVAERILGLMDRRIDSPTAGCFDRPYWHYQTADFPSAWFNNAVEYLVLLAKTGEARWQSPRLELWSHAALGFSLSLAHADGSVSEAYPNEHGFCATAFLCAHSAAAVMGLGANPDVRLGRMAEFLMTDRRTHPSNQVATAALALLRVSKLLGNAKYRDAGAGMLQSLFASQRADGSFPEHGGGDIGYQTVTLSALAQIEREDLEKIRQEPVRGAVAFVDRVVRADGTFDYSKTSRRTQFLYPYGLAVFRSDALQRLIAGLKSGQALRPSWLDDRYVGGLATDYLRTGQLPEAT